MSRLIRRFASKAGLVFARLLALLAAMGLPGLGAAEAPDAGGLTTLALKHEDLDRTYHVHLPPGFKKESKAPLVLVLHGGGGNGLNFDKHMGGAMTAAADARGMVAVFPEGLDHQWSDGRTEHLAEGSKGHDDVGFLSKVIERMQADYGCDPKRTYVTGISNGGFMSFRMALDRSDLLAAAAPVTAQVSDACKDKRPAQPISLMLVNGTKDPLVPYDGGDVRITRFGKSRGKIRSTDESLELFRKANGCGKKQPKEVLPDTDPGDGTRVELERWAGGRDGAEVVLVRVVGGGHAWPGGKQYLPEGLVGKASRDLDASALILDFFLAHPKPGAAPAPLEKPAAGTHTVDLKAGGLDRQYLVHVPAKCDGKTAAPVVLAFHGGGGHAKEMINSSGWVEKADEAGFLLVAPEGSRAKPGERASLLRNPQTWNDGSGRFPSGRQDVDDVAFVRAVLDDVAKRYAIDTRRIYATGFSNGSSMTYRLGAELSDRLAAIAPVASSGLRVKVEKLASPVPMLTIQGGADPRNPLEGGRVNGGDGIEERPPVRKSVERWAELNGCGTKSALVSDTNGVRIERYGPGRGGAEVLFYVVEGMGHVWPGKASVLPEILVGKATDKLDGTAVIWDFFRAHARPQ